MSSDCFGQEYGQEFGQKESENIVKQNMKFKTIYSLEIFLGLICFYREHFSLHTTKDQPTKFAIGNAVVEHCSVVCGLLIQNLTMEHFTVWL